LIPPIDVCHQQPELPFEPNYGSLTGWLILETVETTNLEKRAEIFAIL
jgi:hypothetical protein